MAVGLLTPSRAYRPFRYPWAYDLWKKQQQVHWMPEEAQLGEDIKDWRVNLDDGERNQLTHIFRYFTQSDVEVLNNYQSKLARTFKPVEVQMMLTANANMETIHAAAYALLVDTVGMPEATFSAFLDYDEMKAKSEYNAKFNAKSHEDRLLNLAHFSAFTEGLQLWSSFAVLLNYPRHGKMKGMGQIVSWSVRDESLHCEGGIKLFHAYAKETGALTKAVRDQIFSNALDVVVMEDHLIDRLFELGSVKGLTAADVKQYVRFICDWRLQQLELDEMFRVRENPLPWVQEMISAQEHANFFETRATEYSKATSGGTWEGTWAHFDSLKGN